MEIDHLIVCHVGYQYYKAFSVIQIFFINVNMDDISYIIVGKGVTVKSNIKMSFFLSVIRICL